MHPITALILLAIACAVAYLWPWRGNRVRNPRKHPTADAEYTVAWIDNEPHAFTDEQLEVARLRAAKLKLE